MRIKFLIVLFAFLTIFNGEAQDFNYSISECQSNCRIVSEVISDSITEHGYQLFMGVHLNCIVGPTSVLEYEYSNDTLTILVAEHKIHADTVIVRSDSSTTITISESREMATCRCFFYISFSNQHILTAPETILINGLSFEENYRSRTIIEAAAPKTKEN